MASPLSVKRTSRYSWGYQGLRPFRGRVQLANVLATVGCARPSRSAALVKLSVFVTARKDRSWAGF